MKTVFSDNDLLLFLYDEMPYQDANALVKALAEDENLLARYEYFQRVSGQVSTISYEPSDTSIQSILQVVAEEKPKAPSSSLGNGNWRTAILTGVCMLAFGITAFIGTQSRQMEGSSSASVVTTSSINAEAVWDDDSFSEQIEGIQDRTKELQDPIL